MLQFIKDGTVIPFMKIKGTVELICIALVIGSIVAMCTKGLNWGLDFTGGIVVETEYTDGVDLSQVKDAYAKEGIVGTTQHFGSQKDVMVRVAPKEGLDQQTVTNKVMVASRTIDKDVKLSRSEYVGPAVGEELVESGILAYVAFRFEWRMATGAVISLAYDVIVVLGVFSVMQIEYDLTVLAAVLTVVGYSLNDKIVVFDRIRENAVNLPRNTSMYDVFNISITETLSRTIITSGTTLITVVSLMIFGGEMIYGFALALFVGIVFGTISSIYVASTWALILGIKRENLVPVKVEKKESDGYETMD